MVLKEENMQDINSVTNVTLKNSTEGEEITSADQTRQAINRKRKNDNYKAPVCETRLQSLVVQAGYSIKLSVVITGCPEPEVTWTLDDQVIEEDEKFLFEHDQSINKYSLLIAQITTNQAGCYQCTAKNSEGKDSTIGFISVKDSSKQRRSRSVSRRPMVSTIIEYKSKEEAEIDPVKERLLLLNRHCWNWSNLGTSDDSRSERGQSCEPDTTDKSNKSEEDWEDARRKREMSSVRCRSLPNMTNGLAVENKYAKLKSFWEQLMRKP